MSNAVTFCVSLAIYILNIDLSKIYIANDTQKVTAFDMTGCFNISVEAADTDTFVIRLTEQDRVQAMYYGNSTIAGDGSPALVVFDAGAVFDIAGNRNDPASFPLLEIPDTIKPFTFSPTIYFGNGSLELLASETLELTPRSFFNDTKVIFRLRGVSYHLSGAQIVEKDSTRATIQLTELQRLTVLKYTSLYGSHSDGTEYGTFYVGTPAYTAAQLFIEFGAFVDIGQNPSDAFGPTSIQQFADTVRPQIVGAIIDYNDGNVRLEATETLGYNGLDVGEFARPSFYDIDIDGDLDLFCGAKDGNIHYFENKKDSVGYDYYEKETTVPKFGAQSFGDGHSALVFLHYNKLQPKLLSNQNDGKIDALFYDRTGTNKLFYQHPAGTFVEYTNINDLAGPRCNARQIRR
jgi:hypothetical protein